VRLPERYIVAFAAQQAPAAQVIADSIRIVCLEKLGDIECILCCASIVSHGLSGARMARDATFMHTIGRVHMVRQTQPRPHATFPLNTTGARVDWVENAFRGGTQPDSSIYLVWLTYLVWSVYLHIKLCPDCSYLDIFRPSSYVSDEAHKLRGCIARFRYLTVGTAVV